MKEYYYPEEVNRETRTLRRTITYTETSLHLQSEIPLHITEEDVQTLHKIWRRAGERYRDHRRNQQLESLKSNSQRAEERSWEAYLKTTDRPSIGEWRRQQLWRFAVVANEKEVEPQ